LLSLFYHIIYEPQYKINKKPGSHWEKSEVLIFLKLNQGGLTAILRRGYLKTLLTKIFLMKISRIGSLTALNKMA
jgi:hypothetical protein